VRGAVIVAVVHVLREGTGVGEALATFTTLERFLAAVQTFVLRQVVLVLERLRAEVTREWTGS